MHDQVPHDHTERWDDTDIRALQQLRGDGITLTVCAERLGRTKNAVRSKLHRLRKVSDS